MPTVETYIAQFDPEIQARLRAIRQLFFAVALDGDECIRYNMPAYKVGEHHLYYAAYKKHIGFYPVYGMPDLEDEIKPYRGKGTKDSLHFPHHQPLPVELIRKIIVYRAGLR